MGFVTNNIDLHSIETAQCGLEIIFKTSQKRVCNAVTDWVLRNNDVTSERPMGSIVFNERLITADLKVTTRTTATTTV